MLETLRRWWKNSPPLTDFGPIQAWAAAHKLQYRTVREGDGCMLEPTGAPPAWRIEWGHSQRSFIEGRELRIIGEVGTPRDLVALVLTRPLMQSLEKQVFDQYIEDVKTRLDSQAPPEMRWLVLYSKLSSAELGPLREHFGAVGSLKSWVLQWLTQPLHQALASSFPAVAAGAPMLLSISRGRLTLRAPMAAVNAEQLAIWLGVFEQAQREARRLSREWADSMEANQNTEPAAWPRSAISDEADLGTPVPASLAEKPLS